MRVLFTATPHPLSVPRGEQYEAGVVYDLNPDQTARWMRRGVAIIAPPEEPAPAPRPSFGGAPSKPVAAIVPPADESSDNESDSKDSFGGKDAAPSSNTLRAPAGAVNTNGGNKNR